MLSIQRAFNGLLLRRIFCVGLAVAVLAAIFLFSNQVNQASQQFSGSIAGWVGERLHLLTWDDVMEKTARFEEVNLILMDGMQPVTIDETEYYVGGTILNAYSSVSLSTVGSSMNYIQMQEGMSFRLEIDLNNLTIATVTG